MGAAGGPFISTCSGTPSSVSTVSGRPRSSPSSSADAGSPRPRSRATAIRSAATTAPAPATVAPATTPAAPVTRRQLAMLPSRCLPSGTCSARPAQGAAQAGRHLPRALPLCGGCRNTIALMCYSRVASGRPPAESGHDLIGDRPEGVGPFLGGRLARVAGPEQDDLVPLQGGLAPEIHDELVHAHGAGDLPAPPPHVHFRPPKRVARDAFRVAQRHQ